MHYIPLNDWACAVWGLETRAYFQTELDANPHLQAALNADALVRVPEPTSETPPATRPEIDAAPETKGNSE